MSKIPMPRLSDSMEEGTILKWLVADGEPVAKGDELVEIETDKATVSYTAEEDGILEILAAEGETVAVDVAIARIGAPVGRGAGAGAGAAKAEVAVAAPPEPVADDEPEPVPVAAGAPTITPAQHESNGHRPPATPLARRIAQAHQVPLDRLTGTGPRGRITRADVLAAAGIEAPAAAPRINEAPATPSTSPGDSVDARGEREVVPASRVQQLIARRMVAAKSTVPHFQVQTEVVMDRATALRSELKELAPAGEGAPSLNDLVVKACATALRRHARANGSWVEDHFELYSRVNIGLAVAAGDALLVPVLFDADTKSLGQIARETRALAERARAGSLAPAELSGATFTVSNLGMYGMTAIVPVIDTPQAAILGVGAVRETLAREDGEIIDRSLMTLTLSCDHRILYGADASEFLAEVKGMLEAPLQLAL